MKGRSGVLQNIYQEFWVGVFKEYKRGKGEESA